MIARQQLLQRRAALLEKISQQREQIALAGERVQPAFHVADQAVQAGLLVVRRRGVLGLFRMSWRAWQAYRYFGAVSQRPQSRR